MKPAIYITSKEYAKRGLGLHRQGKCAEAISDYHKAIELDPKNGRFYNNLGSVLLKQGKLPEATSNYNKAIALDPKYGMAYSNRGFAHEQQGKLVKAVSDYITAIELGSSKQSVINLTNLINKLSKPELFNLLIALPFSIQLRALRECRNKNTLFGRKFWEQEGLFKCDLKSGSLKNINQRILDLENIAILWLGLIGPELVRDNKVSADIFRVITAHFLNIDFSIVNSKKSINPALLFQENKKQIPHNAEMDKPVFRV